MPSASTSMGVREITDNRARGAWSHEYGVKHNSSADQTPFLDSVLDSVVLAVSGKDYAPYYMRPGKIKLSTTWELYRARAVRIIGAGYTVNNTGPRNHGGSATMSGSDLYWAGSAGGTVITVNETSFLQLDGFSIYLDESNGANKAALGILWKQDVASGHGSNSVRNCSVVAMAHGGTGFQFGQSSGDLNVDTFFCERTRFQNLAIGCLVKHSQGMEWNYNCPTFQNCDTWWHFENGGNFFAFGIQAQDARASQNIVMVKVTTCGRTQGHYHLYGGFLDRQGSSTWVTIFEGSESVGNARFAAYGISVRNTGGGTSYDGSQRAYIEAYGGPLNNHTTTIYRLQDCNLPSQSVVRFRTSGENSQRPFIEVNGCTVDDVKFGSQLVTCNEGGFCGDVSFNNCPVVDTDTAQTVTVNRFPIVGHSQSHWDIDNFDATDGPTEPTWASSWLGGGASSSPSWAGTMAAYYPFNEPIGATLAIDRVNSTALDLTIDSDMQVLWPPMPYLDQWCDFSRSDSTHGRDTGVSINTGFENLTVFGFIELEAKLAGRCAFAVNTSGNDFQIARISDASGNLSCGNSGGSTTFFNNLRIKHPIFFVWTANAGADTWDVYINGNFVLTKTFAGYQSIGSGTVYVGGRNAAGATVWPGKLSRVGIAKTYLTAKQATILSLQATTCAERRHRNPT